MTATWNGYPPNPDEHGMHVIASKLGRNPTVFVWNASNQVWEDTGVIGSMTPGEASVYSYIGRVVA